MAGDGGSVARLRQVIPGVVVRGRLRRSRTAGSWCALMHAMRLCGTVRRPVQVYRVVDLGFHGAEDIEDCSCHLIEFREILDFIAVLDKRANHPAVGHHVLAALHECIEPGAVGGWQRGEDG